MRRHRRYIIGKTWPLQEAGIISTAFLVVGDWAGSAEKTNLKVRVWLHTRIWIIIVLNFV